jgi:hypothetical protein
MLPSGKPISRGYTDFTNTSWRGMIHVGSIDMGGVDFIIAKLNWPVSFDDARFMMEDIPSGHS